MYNLPTYVPPRRPTLKDAVAGVESVIADAASRSTTLAPVTVCAPTYLGVRDLAPFWSAVEAEMMGTDWALAPSVALGGCARLVVPAPAHVANKP